MVMVVVGAVVRDSGDAVDDDDDDDDSDAGHYHNRPADCELVALHSNAAGPSQSHPPMTVAHYHRTHRHTHTNTH